MSRTFFPALALAAAALTFSGEAAAISRGEVIARAKAFAFHPWTCAAQNLTASCAPSYQSVYVPGDFEGLPYDWGGYMTLFQFDQSIAAGAGAGSYPSDGVLSCTSGLDCSGFVSQSWAAPHHTTSTLSQIAATVAMSDILPGDAFNDAGTHVVLYSHTLASGQPVFYEAAGYNVHVNTTDGWSHVSGYTPRRFQGITGTTAAEPVGTPDNPIVISSFPYTDSRDTKQSGSDLLDGCGAAPGKAETGPEYVYRVTFTTPGQLTAKVSDDVSADIDIHLYTSLNTNDCVARDDSTITVNVDCGTYWLVADTFKGAVEYPGLYTLTATFTPSSAPCGGGPPVYAPSGGPGDPCGYPGAPDLPFCNPNLGADTCLYTDHDSFCSIPCASAADCAAFAGGCCGDIGGGEMYCLTAASCGSAPPTPMDPPDAGGDPPPDTTVAGAGGGGGGANASGAGGAGGSPAGSAGASNGGSGGAHAQPGARGSCSAGGPTGGLPDGGAALLALAAGLALGRRRRA
jgi:MYXO-CTERM domain-containing protein